MKICLAATALVLLATSLPLSAQTKVLGDCKSLTDRTARYACYDQADDLKPSSPPAGATQSTIPARAASAPSDAAPVAAARATQGGSDKSALSAGKSSAAAGVAPGEIHDTIASLKEIKQNVWRITLNNKEVWQQVDSQRYALQAGDVVTLRSSKWGTNYRLSTDRLGGFIQVQLVSKD